MHWRYFLLNLSGELLEAVQGTDWGCRAGAFQKLSVHFGTLLGNLD